MVAIVAGKGLGLLNTSANTIGEAGVLGQSALGRGGNRAIVNAANGNLILQVQDAWLAGCGTDLFALRTYNSLGTPTDSDGEGWRWSYEQVVRFQGPGAPLQPGPGAMAIRTDGDGHETGYAWNAARAAYVATEGSGAHDELTYDGAAAEWVWTDGSLGVTERYSNSSGPEMTGRLLRRTDISNNSIALAYDGDRLALIQDTASQQELRLTYGTFNGLTRPQRIEARALLDDPNGHATATLGDPLRLVEYGYDTQGRLTTVTRHLAPNGGNSPASAGFVTTYGYTDSSSRIASVTQGDGTSVSFAYDDTGRVSAVSNDGAAPGALLALAYDLQQNSTAITDGGGQVWTYRHDGMTGQLTEVLTPAVNGAGLSTMFRYDAAGNLLGITDPRNKAVTYGYDNAGNRALERDAAGNTTTRTFSPLNQVLTETRYRIPDPDHVGPQVPDDPVTTRYVYDANVRLRFMVSAEGRVTEHRYGASMAGNGLLAQSLLYVGQLYDVTGLGPAQQLTETELGDWVAGLPDKTQVQLTEYGYDLRGNMRQQTSYATVGATGTGVLDAQAGVSEYSYDAHSQLRQRIAVRGSARDRRTVVTSFTHDGLLRVLNSGGADGLQTTVYDDANRRVTVTMASGLIETRVYDSRGRLVSLSQAGDGTMRLTRYVYDSADRPRMVEDATGGRRYRFYDAAGRLVFKVDAAGAVTRFEHDAAGLLARQTQYLNRVDTTAWYDKATQTVTKGSLSVGGAGSDVIVDAAHDRVTSFDYDDAGRLTATTDATNTVTTVSYDGLSRVVMTQTGDRVIRYLYDKDHRRVGIVDALGYFTEYKYDAGGRPIETLRYSQRSPAAANMTAPVWIGATQQTVVAGRPLEYRVPAYDADGDPLTFSVVGAAPAWLSFDAATATLRGTPPAAATSASITLRAGDGRGSTSDVTVQFTVGPTVPDAGGHGGGPAWGPLSPLDVVANTPLSHVLPPATGQSLTYRVVGGLPPGLAFDASTRTITGSCGAIGFYSILLRATDAGGPAADRTLPVRVRAAATASAQPAGSDQPSAWRPTDPDALHSYLYYDGQGRVVGAVDEQQFLTETVYDDALNTQRTLRYPTPVAVAVGDTLASLKTRAGSARQISLVQYDDFGRVHETTGLDGVTVTRNEYDQAGRLVRVVSAANTNEQRVRRTFYNAFDEVTATLGGEGDAWLGANPTPQRIDQAIRDYGIRHEYDLLGRMVRSVDANGNRTLFYYDHESRRTHIVNVVGHVSDSSLAGEVSETAYNSFGQPAAVRRYAARIASADMNELLANGGGGLAHPLLLDKLAALAEPTLDQVTLYEYDRCGRLTKQVDGEGGFTENLYNAYGELAAQLRSIREGQTTARQLDYDLNGRLVSRTGDAGGISMNTRTDYDAFGRVIRSVDGAGRATTTTYPDSGRSILVTDPLQRATRTDYEALGRVSKLTDALGQAILHTYDDPTRSMTVTMPEGGQVSTVRTRHGETLSVTDGHGNVTRFGFNRDGQPTTVIDALGQLIEQTIYDNSGRRLDVTDARGTVTRFGYDQRNRVIERRLDPGGLNLATLFEFDALGQQIKVTEAAGTEAARVTNYAFDRKGRTRTVVVDGGAEGLQLCTSYGYDGLDNAVTVARGTLSSPSQHVMLYEFDNLGRRVKEIAAPASVFGPGAPGARDLTTQYRYDAGGHLSRRIDPNGHSTWLAYDAAGQQTHGISALGEVSESRYDAAGQLVYSHGYLDRLATSMVGGFGDIVGAVTMPAATSGDRREYVVYDGDGRARFSLKAAGEAGWIVGENRYDANGNLIEVRAYDKFLPDARVTALDSAASPGITVAEIQQELSATLGYQDDDPATLAGVQRTFFAYDANNRRRFAVDPSGLVTESVHDAAGNAIATVRFAVRPVLVEHTESAIDAAVDRDDSDNRRTRHAHDAANRLRYTVDTLGSVSESEFDARGNVVKTVRWATRPALTQYTESAIAAALAGMPAAETDQVTRLVYDAGNRLRFTIDAMGSVSENAYDAMGSIIAATRFARRPAVALTSFTETDVGAVVAPLRDDVENQVTRFAYDAEKRLRFAVDALGSVTESAYDANGNLLTTTRFAARPALAQHDEATIAAALAPLQADPRNRATRFAYDGQNRLRFTADALGSISERAYDALGSRTASARFAVRPPLAQFTEGAIAAAVAPDRDHPGNRLEYHLYDALGRLRFNVLRLSLEAGQARYQVTGQALNALGQTVTSTAYATPVALGALTEAAIVAAVGSGDPSRDRVSGFVHDLAGRQIYRLQAVTVPTDQRMYRVSAQRFDAFGQGVSSTDYATPVALDAFDQASVEAAAQAIADPARDRVSAVAYDALGQAIYSVQVLGPGSHQVVEQEYDALGRVFRTRQYANAVGPLASFDRTTIEAAVAAVAGANDRSVQYVHDAAGRQRFALEADRTGYWSVGESRYDALGNLVESRRYDRFVTDAWIATLDATRPMGALEQDVIGQLSALGYDDAAPASLANIQRSRFAYDRQNQLRFTVDALGSVAENVYDGLGDLTTTVRFAARPAPAQYSENAIDAAVDRNDAGNRVQHMAYDALGQQRFNVQVIEPNAGSGGQHWIIEQRYDPLGQLVESRAFATIVGHLGAYDEGTLAAAVVTDALNDRRSAVAYDSGDRRVYAVREQYVGRDGGSGCVVTKHVYDALRLVQRIDYASPAGLAQFDKASVEGAVVPHPVNDRITTYVHDAGGHLRFEIRPDLSFRETEYDALDQVTQTRQFDFRLPAHAPRTEADMIALRGNRAVGDGVTRGQANTWDAGGRLIGTVDALGHAEQYEYDALGGRLRWIDKNGNGWSCAHDRKGRKTAETTPSFSFKLSGEAPATPAPDRVLETHLEYDAFGNLIRKIEAANFADDASTTDFLFDTLGRPTGTLYNGFYDAVTQTVERDAGANRFRLEAAITYDAMGNAVRISNRTGVDTFEHTWRTYDSQGQVVHEINALNNVTRYSYNSFGERETVTRYSVTISGTPQNGMYWTAGEVDPKLNWGYDENGNVLEDYNARTIRLAYDKLGRKSAVTLPTAAFYSTQMPGDASQANYFRPNPASVLAVQDAPVTRYEYNAFGDMTLQRVRANTIVEWQDTSFSYDAMGRRTRSVDAAGNVTTTSYDTAGNPVRQAELTGQGQPDGTDRITAFAYNLLDQQTRVDRYGLRYTDASGIEHGVATWTWENGGEWLDPDADVATTVRTATYDGYGKLLAVTDAAGNATLMRYNALSQLIEVIGPACPVAPFAANGDTAVDPFRNQLAETLVTSMTLDAFGRPVRQLRATAQGGDARETLQSYDTAGNLVSTTDAEGNVKRRACDAAGRVIRETQAIQADLGPLGTNAEGLERRYLYDALGQLTDTLDVYLDGTDRVQSGKSVLYNAFGEVVEERRKWGPASQSPTSLNMARVTWYHYNNAGHVFEKLAADRLTLYYYNLLGQVTREEKRGNSGDTDGTGHRVTEFQYDVLGRATMVRRPAFDADITPGTGTTIRLVTPYSSRMLDRWGNAANTQEGGYQFINGQPSYAPYRIFRSYAYDDNNRVVTESLGTHEFVSSGGALKHAQLYKRTLRDLLGNAVKEVDEARDPQSEELISSRARSRQYDNVGKLTAEIDASNRKLEYAYSIHGERLGTRNTRGTVLFDRRDRNGNVRFRGVLRTSSPTGAGEYNSFEGTGTITRTYLNAYLYDQANRRFASKTFTEGANAPWAYTWLDGRNLGIRQRDAMGVVSQYRFDPFGNKALEIDGAGARSEWNAATADYVVGRIETYREPADSGTKFGQHTYNDYSEVRVHTLGNTRTEYGHHKNGLVSEATIMPDVTQSSVLEITRYQYDARGQLTMEGRFDSDSIQAKMISYDNQGRLSRVEQSKTPGGVTCDVRHAYDEWHDVRRIEASYTHTGMDGPWTSASWYEYDAAGRMTISNGALVNGAIRPKMRVPGSVKIGYDNVGRRSGTTEYTHHGSASLPTMLRTWDTMRDERYAYNDLGHLLRIEQRIRHVNIVETARRGSGDPVSRPDRIGDWQPLSTRAANLRGEATRAEQWTRLSGTLNNIQVDQVPTFLGTTTTSYRADGQVAWTRTDAPDPNKSTETQNTYNTQTGQLDSYVFKAFRSDGVPFSATFEYRYTYQNGARAVRRIRDAHTGLDTSKTYDLLGRLTYERIDLQKPNGAGSDRYEERFYDHGADARIIFKDSRLRLSASGPGTVPLPTPSQGQQTYVFAGERMTATVGAERLVRATRFDFAYTPMSEAAGGGTSRHIVQSGDSLIDIARANYGDGALWYVIADANGIVAEPGDPLPATEIGKAYEVPEVVRSSQSATTFKPYSLAEIIGNDRPIAIPPPPPPQVSDIEVMAVVAVSITIQVGATVGLSVLGVPVPVSYAIGAGLSNLGGQATSWGLDMQAPGQDGIDWGQVGIAAMEGYMFSVAGPVAGISREIWQQGKGGFAGWTSGPGLNWSGIGGSLFNVGFDALGPTLGGPKVGAFNFGLGGLINSAYNPSSGWAIPGSGRSPTVGAFEYAYSGVANGLANIGYNWIRDQLDRPSTPAQASVPRSVDDPKGPLPAELIDLWDEIDRQYIQELDSAALAARNEQIAAASNERLAWQLRLGALQDRIAHLGENIDDREIISSVLRQRNAERIHRERVAAVARARAALRAARLRANTAKIEAQMAARPDPALVQYGRDMEELNNQLVKDMYAEGTLVRVSDNVEIDGLKLTQTSGIYDTMGLYSGKNRLLEEEIRRYREFRKDDPSLEGLEIIAIESAITPAEQARRLGLADVKTFKEFSKSYARAHGNSEGVYKAFLEYHAQRSREINANWDRIDNAAGAVNLIAKGTGAGLLFMVDPVGTVGSIVVGVGTEKALVAAGIPEDAAALIGGLAGGMTGLGVSYAQLARSPGTTVRNVLRAQRAARADYDAARLAAQAAEFEMSKGVQIAEGVALFKGVPAQARAARSAVFVPALLDAPPPPPAAYVSPLLAARSGTPALRLADDVPIAGGVPALASVDYHVPGAIQALVPYEATATRGVSTAWQGGFEPSSGVVANITDGGGFAGGASGRAPLILPAINYPSAQGERLITVFEGRAWYQSTGTSGSKIPGEAELFYKERGMFYEMFGVQEQRWIRQGHKPFPRGYVIKGYDPNTLKYLGKNLHKEPRLTGASFQVQGSLTQPEQINQWLAEHGFIPWIDLRHLRGRGWNLLE